MTTDQRLARVETQNARMKVVVAGMGVVLAVVLLIGAGQDQDTPKVLEEVRARKFVLVDDKGTIRASLHVESRSGLNATHLWLYDPAGIARIGAEASELGGAFCGYANRGDRRFLLAADAKGGRGLKFPGEAAAAFVIDESNLPTLLLGRKGKFRAVLKLDPAGEPSLTLNDKNGNPIFKAPK